MCVDYDLFGDVIVTLNDVELWLNNQPRLSGLPHRQKAYLQNYDVASIIKRAKIDNSYYELFNDKLNLSYSPAESFFHAQKYVNTAPAKCPDYYHECTNPFCAIYIKAKKRDYSRLMYEKRKKERL